MTARSGWVALPRIAAEIPCPTRWGEGNGVRVRSVPLGDPPPKPPDFASTLANASARRDFMMPSHSASIRAAASVSCCVFSGKLAASLFNRSMAAFTLAVKLVIVSQVFGFIIECASFHCGLLFGDRQLLQLLYTLKKLSDFSNRHKAQAVAYS